MGPDHVLLSNLHRDRQRGGTQHDTDIAETLLHNYAALVALVAPELSWSWWKTSQTCTLIALD